MLTTFLPSKCLLLSIRLSPAAVRNLLNQTGTKAIVASPRNRQSIEDAMHEERNPSNVRNEIEVAPPIDCFLSISINATFPAYDYTHKRTVRENDRNVLILHSSGTTGMFQGNVDETSLHLYVLKDFRKPFLSHIGICSDMRPVICFH